MTILYKYLGGGFLPHVPARDITEADVEQRVELWLENGIDEALLLKSGLYEKVPDIVEEAGKAFLDGFIEGLNKTDKPAKKNKAEKAGE